MPLPRTVPKGGAVIAGHFFPEGESHFGDDKRRPLIHFTAQASRLACLRKYKTNPFWLSTSFLLTPSASFVLQRSEAAFGADAEEFKPSRWLDANINERVAMHAKILSFGTLARVCVGKVCRLLM